MTNMKTYYLLIIFGENHREKVEFSGSSKDAKIFLTAYLKRAGNKPHVYVTVSRDTKSRDVVAEYTTNENGKLARL